MRFTSNKLATLATVAFALALAATTAGCQTKINPGKQIAWPPGAAQCDVAGMVYSPQSNTCIAPGGGAPGSVKDVPFNAGGGLFASDPGKFYYDLSSHFLFANANGRINSELYGGVTGALASANCGVNCLVYQPASSADLSSTPTPTTGKTILSDRGGTRTWFSHNPGGATLTDNQFFGFCHGEQTGVCLAALFDTPNPYAASISARPVGWTRVANQNQWCYNYGNAPGNGGANWCVYKHEQNAGEWNSQGITQNRSDLFVKHATGDAVFGQNVDKGLTDGGTPDWSGEGNAAYRGFFGETSDYYHGLVGGGASAGATSIPVGYNSAVSTNNRNASSAGAFVLDITQGTLSGAVTGNATALAGYPTGTTATIGLVPIDAAVTPSTAYGNVACTLAIGSTANPNLVTTQTCTVNNIAGTSGTFTTGRAYIAGDFPEEVAITAPVPASGGSQSVTITFLHPHNAAATTLWQGSNVVGTFISYDRYMAINGFREAYHVFGATDANHLVVEQAYLNAGGPYSAYLAPTPVLNLSKSGTTVTATVANANVNIALFNKQSSAVVAGCSDASLNGTVGPVASNLSALSLTWTQSGGGTGCASATLSLPAVNGFHLYPGAEQLGPAQDSPTSLFLGTNSVPWTAGDQIEIPHHPFWSGQFTHWTHTVNNALDNKKSSTGIDFSYGGGGISSNYTPFAMSNTNPCAMYQGCGGLLTAPPAIYIGGFNANNVNGGAIALAEPPLAGAPIITVKSYDTNTGPTASTDPVALFALGYSAASALYYRPATSDYLAVGGFSAGSAASGQYGYGFFHGGRYWVRGATSSDAASYGGIYFTLDGTTELTRMGLCNKNSSLKEVSFGTCQPFHGSDTNVTDGKVNALSARIQADATLGSVTVGLQPIAADAFGAYTGTAGTTSRIYYLAAQSPLGLQGAWSGGFTVIDTAATLDASNYVTVTCPTALQANYPAGTTYHVWFRTSSTLSADVGTCPVGGTLKDDGTYTNSPTAVANVTVAGNMQSQAGQYQVAQGGSVGFWNSNRSGAMDAFINRLGAGLLGIGTTAGSAHDAALELANIQVDSLSGTGSRCLHTDATGHVSATASDCGTGGGGGGTNPTATGMQYWDNIALAWSAVTGINVTGGAVSGLTISGSGGGVFASGIIDGLTATVTTTGTAVTVADTSGPCAPTACFGEYLYNNVTGGTAAATFTLPAAQAGMAYCFENAVGVTGPMSIQTSGTGQFIAYQGANSASGGYLSMGGALGDALCVKAASSTQWYTVVQSGTPTLH